MGKPGLRGDGSQRWKRAGGAGCFWGSREGPGVGSLPRSPLFLSEVRRVRRSWWLWAQGLETRRDCVIGLFVPQVPGTNVLTVAWPQGLRRCQHIRILKLEMGHRCQSSGLSRSYEHTPKGRETEIETRDPSIMRPLTHTQALSGSTFFSDLLKSEHKMASFPGPLWSVPEASHPGAGPLNPTVADCGHRLGRAEAVRAAPASLHHWLHLAVPLAGPACLPAFQLSEFCPFGHSSPVLVHQRPQKFSCSQSSWPCLLITISRSPAGLQKEAAGHGSSLQGAPLT